MFRRDVEKMKKSEKNRATKKRENFQNGCQSENLQNTDFESRASANSATPA